MTHPGTDVLAEFRAGLITGHRGDRISAHLADCQQCRATDARLAGMPALLSAGPPPVMPADVAQRLDQVLAAEVAHRDQAERAADSAPPQVPAPRRRRRRGFRWPPLRVLAPVAVVVVFVAGVVFAVSRPGSSEYMGPDSSTAAGSAGQSVAAGAAPKAQAPEQGSPEQGSPAQGSAAQGTLPSPDRQGQPVSFVYVASRTDFAPATLTSQLERELARTPAAAGTVQAMPAAVRGCVARVAPGASVVRVETARYQGQPATVIFTQNGQVTRAVITSPDCSGTSGHVVAAANLPAGISGP
jgi:hypothetical protein